MYNINYGNNNTRDCSETCNNIALSFVLCNYKSQSQSLVVSTIMVTVYNYLESCMHDIVHATSLCTPTIIINRMKLQVATQYIIVTIILTIISHHTSIIKMYQKSGGKLSLVTVTYIRVWLQL